MTTTTILRPATVPAGPTRALLADLADLVGPTMAAEMTGLTRPIVDTLLATTHGYVPTYLARSVEQALRQALADESLHHAPAGELIRRVRSLGAWGGYTPDWIAQQVDCTPQELQPTGDSVPRWLLDAVDTLYRRLPGPATEESTGIPADQLRQTAAAALREGYGPPAAYEDSGQLAPGSTRKRDVDPYSRQMERQERRERVRQEWLAHPYLDDRRIAARCGVGEQLVREIRHSLGPQWRGGAEDRRLAFAGRDPRQERQRMHQQIRQAWLEDPLAHDTQIAALCGCTVAQAVHVRRGMGDHWRGDPRQRREAFARLGLLEPPVEVA